MRRLAAAAFAAWLVACGGEDGSRAVRPPPHAAVTVDAGVAPLADPLGPRPEASDPPPYTPPVPVTYKRDGGLTVWLLERHGLPLVSLEIVVPSGSASDPEGKAGLAYMTANMLDEGAGARGPLEISRDVDRLGASLLMGTEADYGWARLTVLKKNLAAAAAIFGDVVAKPQLSAVEWKRVHDLWENRLRERQSEPQGVASVVARRKTFPAGHPYGHPVDGLLSTAPKVALDDVKKLYAARWRPDAATCVVVGDITRAELDTVLDQALGAWRPPPVAPPAEPAPVAFPRSSSRGPRKIFVVDRADAPQSVITLARPGVSAAEDEGVLLHRVNTALGGSFTSRLNQDLREEHGWSYGAGSGFSATRMRGFFVASAAVHTEHTGEALRAMLADIEGMAKSGLTDEEVRRTKQLTRADLVAAFETVEGSASRLARSAGLGLPPDREAVASRLAAGADKAALDRVAAAQLDLADAVVVVVGPRAKIQAQLEALGNVTVEVTGPEGR